MKSKIYVLLVFVLLIIMTSCKSTESSNLEGTQSYPVEPQKTTEETQEISNSYPVNTETIEPEINDIEIPIPNEDTSVVFGEIQSLTTDEPIAFSKIYLASKVFLDSGDSYVLSFTENESPHSQTNKAGEFAISLIPPGEYVMVLATPIDIYPVLDESGEKVEINLSKGESLDLGLLYGKWPDFD